MGSTGRYGRQYEEIADKHCYINAGVDYRRFTVAAAINGIFTVPVRHKDASAVPANVAVSHQAYIYA